MSFTSTSDILNSTTNGHISDHTSPPTLYKHIVFGVFHVLTRLYAPTYKARSTETFFSSLV